MYVLSTILVDSRLESVNEEFVSCYVQVVIGINLDKVPQTVLYEKVWAYCIAFNVASSRADSYLDAVLCACVYGELERYHNLSVHVNVTRRENVMFITVRSFLEGF